MAVQHWKSIKSSVAMSSEKPIRLHVILLSFYNASCKTLKPASYPIIMEWIHSSIVNYAELSTVSKDYSEINYVSCVLQHVDDA